jgi:hypothetical protein
MWMERIRALFPRTCSRSEADDNRDDESDLRHPGKSRVCVSWLTLEQMQGTTHMTVSMKFKDVDAGEDSLHDYHAGHVSTKGGAECLCELRRGRAA